MHAHRNLGIKCDFFHRKQIQTTTGAATAEATYEKRIRTGQRRANERARQNLTRKSIHTAPPRTAHPSKSNEGDDEGLTTFAFMYDTLNALVARSGRARTRLLGTRFTDTRLWRTFCTLFKDDWRLQRQRKTRKFTTQFVSILREQ